jgi:sugar phosphate isomerase/epimerase
MGRGGAGEKGLSTKVLKMIGVSPAFVVSLYGSGFSTGDFCEALPVIADIGFTAYQPEVYTKEGLADWSRNARNVHDRASGLGLTPTQFVAHFMLEQFAGPGNLHPESGLDELRQVLDIAGVFSPCRVLTIPAPRFDADWDSPWVTSAQGWRDMRALLVEKVSRYLEIVTPRGLKLAFEILPFSIFGGISRFLALCEEIGSPDLGLNFDTGHAWACRELLPSLPFELDGRVFGVHLGDNLSSENIKMAPGKGTIPWTSLLGSLAEAGYKGSRDIEIGCPPDRVVEEYRSGLSYLMSLNVL